MKTILIALLLTTSGCSYLAPNTGSFGEGAANVFMTVLRAKANSNSTQNAYNVGLSQSQPQQLQPFPTMQQSIQNDNAFLQKGQNSYNQMIQNQQDRELLNQIEINQ